MLPWWRVTWLSPLGRGGALGPGNLWLPGQGLRSLAPRWLQERVGGVLAKPPGPPLLARHSGRQRGPGQSPVVHAMVRGRSPEGWAPTGTTVSIALGCPGKGSRALGPGSFLADTCHAWLRTLPGPQWPGLRERGPWAARQALQTRTFGQLVSPSLLRNPSTIEKLAQMSTSCLAPPCPEVSRLRTRGHGRGAECSPGKQLRGAPRPHASPPACLGQ